MDAWDNGHNLVTNDNPEVSPYFLQHIFFAMMPTWREEGASDYEMFMKSVGIAQDILEREIVHANDGLIAEEIVLDTYNKTQDKRVIILDKHYPSMYTLHAVPEPLYVIYPRSESNGWGVKAVRKDPKTFNSRKDFPKSWGGLRDEELQKVTGVSDAVFCHKGLFLAVAKSKDGAIKLAQIAVES